MRRFAYLCILLGGFVATGSVAHALTVSPAKFELTVNPGETYRGEIELFNEQEGSRTFFSSFENFEPRGDSGAPYFIGAKNGLATWMTTAPSVSLNKGDYQTVPFSITVPQSAEPGGYFAAIFFGTQPPTASGGGEVSIGGKIGVLILLRVAGDVPEKGGLVEFSSTRRVMSSLPATFQYRMNNDGGDRIVPKGEIVIRNTFRIVSTKLVANENHGSVLPGSIRRFETKWLPRERGDTAILENPKGFFKTVGHQLRNFHIGLYTARLNVVWGESNQRAHDTHVFFVIPWQLIIAFVIPLYVCWLVARVFLRRYKQSIIAETMRRR